MVDMAGPSVGVDVGAGRLGAAAGLGGGLQRAGALGEPGVVVGPPAPGHGARPARPLLGVGRVLARYPEARAAVRRRRVDERLDVAAARQDEARRAAEQLRAAVGVLPRDD